MATSCRTWCLQVSIDEPGSAMSHNAWKREDSGPDISIFSRETSVRKPSVVTLTTIAFGGSAFINSPTTARTNPVTCAAKNGWVTDEGGRGLFSPRVVSNAVFAWRPWASFPYSEFPISFQNFSSREPLAWRLRFSRTCCTKGKNTEHSCSREFVTSPDSYRCHGTMIPCWIVISAPRDKARAISGAVAHDSPASGKNRPNCSVLTGRQGNRTESGNWKLTSANPMTWPQ